VTRKPKPMMHGRDHEHNSPDPIRIHYESVGTPGGGGASYFAVGIYPSSWDNSDTPLIMDGAGLSSSDVHFDTNDSSTFALSSSGRLHITQTGMYLLSGQVYLYNDAYLSGEGDVWFAMRYFKPSGSEIGYSISVPYLWGGKENIPGNMFTYTTDMGPSTDIALQYTNPISIRNSTLPIEIRPTYDDHVPSDAAGSIKIRALALWGHRLGPPLSSWFSD